ncbi:type II secretion system protein, partial [Vibrio parahaemolyticus]|uniref:type II secretion system protein n=1 Tax=Vibrio parahaemolyticus TaxID=670 RepID=UPI002111FF81
MRRSAVLDIRRVQGGGAGVPGSRAQRSGFTIIDVLVSIAVIAVLISILMPSLSLVRETTRRLVCSSNIRQHGMGLAMY